MQSIPLTLGFTMFRSMQEDETDRLLLEDGSGAILLEDGTGALITEDSPSQGDI
jgi:hypothetical protein